MAILEANTDLDVKGRVLASIVPNSTGSIVTWNASTKVFGLRTNAEIISDLNLSSNFITTNTTQTGLTGNKTSSGIWTLGQVRKAGQTDSSILLAGGGHRPVSDFALAGSLGNYLPLSGGTLSGEISIVKNGQAGANTRFLTLRDTDYSTNQGRVDIAMLATNTNTGTSRGAVISMRRTNNLGTLHFEVADNNLLSLIGNSQNVGVSVETPTEKLDVNGNIRVRALTSSGFVKTNTNGVLSVDTNTYALASSIPTVNNGQLTLSTGTGLTGSATFTANQSGSSTFSVAVASTHKLPTTAEWNALPTTNTITRLRGTTSGTFTSGDLTLLAGANTTITQSGSNITIASTNTNTTYSAGTGLSLTGTTFGQTITTSGTGTFVTGITQTTNGFQVNLGTPPNTTYSAGTLALLQAGTNTTNRVWSSKVIADYVLSMIPTNTDGILSYSSANGIIVTDWNSFALSEYSMSLGYGSVTSGNYATSVGSLLSTTGFGSTNQGYSNSITKSLGYSLGAYNSVRATLSGAFGIGLINRNDGAFIVGRYNSLLPIEPYDTTSPHKQAVFAIGAGRDETDRFTALTVYGDGRADYTEGYDDSTWTNNTLVTKKWVMDNVGGSSGAGGGVAYRNVREQSVFDLSSEYSSSLAESVFHVMTGRPVVFIGGNEVFHDGYKVTIMVSDDRVDISLDNTQGVKFMSGEYSLISYLDQSTTSVTFIYDKEYSLFRAYHVSYTSGL